MVGTVGADTPKAEEKIPWGPGKKSQLGLEDTTPPKATPMPGEEHINQVSFQSCCVANQGKVYLHTKHIGLYFGLSIGNVPAIEDGQNFFKKEKRFLLVAGLSGVCPRPQRL